MTGTRQNGRVSASPERRFAAARVNLLLVVVLTAVNLALLSLGSDTQFLFSASFPSIAYMVGDSLSAAVGGATFRLGGLMLGAGVDALFLLCWLGSGRRRGFLIAALVLFVLDSLAFLALYALAGFSLSGLLDAAFHVWVLVSLILGVAAMPDITAHERAAEEQARALAAALAHQPVENFPAGSVDKAEKDGYNTP